MSARLDPLADRLLRLSDVLAMVGLGESTVYRKVKEKTFPAPLRLGTVVRWRESELIAWIDALPRHDPDVPVSLQGARQPPARTIAAAGR